MKNFRKCPLLVMLVFTLVVFEVLTGIPKMRAFAQKQMNKEEYRVEKIPTVMAADDSKQYVEVAVQEDSVSGNTLGEMDFTEVDEDYFSDALFIGDSRTVGLHEYSGIEQATFYASTGLTVHKVFDAKIVPVEGSKNKITVEEALNTRQFGKIYFMIGINEMGMGTVDSFMEKYTEVVTHIQELQPQAIIFVQAIMRVTTERSEQGDYIHNAGIDERNERIAALADNQRIFFLDVNAEISDLSGGMCKEYTFDGVHLKAEYVALWTEFLKKHGVVQ